MRLIVFFIFFLATIVPTLAQDVVGFRRDDFGKVVLTTGQVASGDLPGNVENYHNEPISKYGKRSVFYRLGGPVGRLDVVTNTETFPCTGFLISPKYLMTNYHCVPGLLDVPAVRRTGARKIDFVQFVLGYTVEGIEEIGRRFSVKVRPAEANRELDYAIMEVSNNPAESYGWLRLASTEPIENTPLWIIGHPRGEAQRISREQCKSSKPAVSGGRLRHTCDTLPGNSGSPVIDPDTKTVIALHHAGSSSKAINYAIPLARILARSAILKTIRAEQTANPQSLAAGDPLRPQPFPPGRDDPKVIAAVMQLQLQRIGCYRGVIDGDWGPGSRGSVSALPKTHRDRLATPIVSFQNVSLLRGLEPEICARAKPAITRPSGSQNSSSSGRGTQNRNPRTVQRAPGGRTSKCIQRAQRYCSNPDNSSAIGYAACLTQAKAGCRD